ncbi:MAG TPA: AAA family ATPase [Steroidobacteraceae bacterium]|nr:AAA family ATPase [Steroidobacteraceae bacterium]
MPGLPASLSSLLRPDAFPHPVAEVRLVETHISWVLLTGEYAYKLKRPVHYPFVDLRAPEHRAFLCEEEVRLNRRFAPELYLGVCPVVAKDGGLRIGGDGPAVEHVVRMRQFDRKEELDRLIEAGEVAPPELEAFGRELALIHARLPLVGAQPWGTFERVSGLLRANLAECRQSAGKFGTAAQVDAASAVLEAHLRSLEPRIAARRAQRIRECHGDLHARNLVRWQGRLAAFDCLEFEPAFRWIDVADEVAFLWMDLIARHRRDLATAFLRGYLDESGDHELCRLLPLYGGHRALVRAKVAALEGSAAQHRDYLDCARELLSPRPPRLIAMSGFSGSGKSWLARQLAPRLDALHLRSDVERKRLAGLKPTAHSHSRVGEDLYSSEASARVYEHLARCADAALSGGIAVIVDATFARRAERARFAELARSHGGALTVIFCDAPLPVLQARIAQRERTPDASEADLDVLAWQRAHADPLTSDEALTHIAVDTSDASALSQVLDRLADS